MSAGGINVRQWVLKKWLENNFVKGKFYSIEEICEQVTYNGEHLYKLNKNPRIHDKCIMLGSDVNVINDNEVDGYKIIIKDSKGSIKLVENEEELKTYLDSIEIPALKILKRVWTIRSKAKLEGTMPIINKANNPVEDKDLKFVDVFMLDDEDFNVKVQN